MSARASGSSARAASSSTSDTGIGTDGASSASRVTRSRKRPAVSSATSEPMLWPTSAARSMPKRVQDRDQPVGESPDRRSHRSAAAAVPGQVEREHVVAVVPK